MKVNKYTIIFTSLLLLFTVYVLLDTFVIVRKYDTVSISETENDLSTGSVESNDNYYKDDNIEISITKTREYDTTIYIADIKLSDASLLRRAFANNSYGKNITDTTSNIASSVNAILAVNGDYYGVQNSGYVLLDGKIYRNTSAGKEDLVIYQDGSFEIINEDDVTLEELVNNGAVNILSFGPALIENGSIVVSENDEVGKAMASNPRTAIGIIDDLHYILVVSDGRTNESEGLSLYELATVMSEYDVKTLYNLDGGGSSTMVFNGNIINNPTTSGRNTKERSVSDIVYIGY